jgi:tetratricopeptide (TPR) repeat protein
MIAVEQLEAVKNDANSNFKVGNYVMACSQYMQIIEQIDLEVTSKGNVPDSFLVLKTGCLNNAAAGFIELRDFEQAVAASSAALKIDTSNAKAKYRRALAYKALGNFTEAISDIKDILRSEPNNSQANSLLEELMHETDSVQSSRVIETNTGPSSNVPTISSHQSEAVCSQLHAVDAAALADITNFVRPDWKPEDDLCTDSAGQPTVVRAQDSISRILQLQSSLAKAKTGHGKGTSGIEALMKRVKISSSSSNDASSNDNKRGIAATAAVNEAIAELNDLEQNAKQRVVQTIAAKEQRARQPNHRSDKSTAKLKDDSSDAVLRRGTTLKNAEQNILSNSAVSAWDDLLQDEASKVTRFRTVIADKDELAKSAAKRKRQVAATNEKK